VVPWCKDGGIKARRAAAEVHSTSPARGTTGGSAGASADGHAQGERAPRGVLLGRRAGVMMLSASGARPTGRRRSTRTSMCRVATRACWRALVPRPCFEFQSSHVWTPNSFKFQNKLQNL
jgi:hypothetical protein